MSWQKEAQISGLGSWISDLESQVLGLERVAVGRVVGVYERDSLFHPPPPLFVLSPLAGFISSRLQQP